MHTLKRFTVLVWLLFPTALYLTAQRSDSPLADLGPLQDQAKLFSSAEAKLLIHLLDSLNLHSKADFAVITITNLVESDIKTAAHQFVEAADLGADKHANYVLILIAQQDRQYFIATGERTERRFPAWELKEWMDEEIVPSFKQGQYDEGIVKALNKLARVQDRPIASWQPEAPPEHPLKAFAMNLINIVVSGFIIFFVIQMHKVKGSGAKRRQHRHKTISRSSSQSGSRPTKSTGSFSGGAGGSY